MTKAKRQYENDYPSVTEVLGILRKIGLENWFKYTPFQQIKKETEEGKTIGIQIHESIQSYIESGKVEVSTQYGDQVINALKGFMQFKKDNPSISLKNAEVQMTSEIYKFNGTLDCIGYLDNKLIIFDWKTGKAKDKDKPDIYDEYKYQVSAYVNAYNEIFKTNIEEAMILSLAKDKIAYNSYFLKKDEINFWFNNVFLPSLRILTAQKEGKKWLTK